MMRGVVFALYLTRGEAIHVTETEKKASILYTIRSNSSTVFAMYTCNLILYLFFCSIYRKVHNCKTTVPASGQKDGTSSRPSRTGLPLTVPNAFLPCNKQQERHSHVG